MTSTEEKLFKYLVDRVIILEESVGNLEGRLMGEQIIINNFKEKIKCLTGETNE